MLLAVAVLSLMAISNYSSGSVKNLRKLVITRKRAAELGMKVPVRRSNPEDFPTFQGED